MPPLKLVIVGLARNMPLINAGKFKCVLFVPFEVNKKVPLLYYTVQMIRKSHRVKGVMTI